jgi:hypothetical protein
MVAVSANSPFLFQASLWEETRIPLFEQAVDTSDLGHPDDCRVTFGERWLETSVLEVFEDNLHRFAPLLPIAFDSPASELRHLRLHNGTIWRWNRPLVGFDAAGTPHLRIEHRPLPSGPTILDEVANAALFLGLLLGVARQYGDVRTRFQFGDVRGNFLAGARYGLNAMFQWEAGTTVPARALIAEHLVPLAHEGLASVGLPQEERDRYLGVIVLKCLCQARDQIQR